MYSKFVFSNFSNHDLNKRQRHPYGAFLDIFDGINDENLYWHCKKRMFQHKICATSEDAATDSYATHPDMRCHTGGMISLGHGIIKSKSSKQKINTCLLYTSDAADE